MGRLLVSLFLLGFFAAMMNSCGSRMSSVKPHSPFDTVEYDSNDPTESAWSGGGTAYNDGSSVELQRKPDGHFYADVQINGTSVHMLVDTGATGIALSRDDARSAGIATSIGMNDVVGEGADGSVHGEFVTVDRITLGARSASGLQAIVLNSGQQSLLGQQFLSKFDSVEIRGDTMVLK